MKANIRLSVCRKVELGLMTPVLDVPSNSLRAVNFVRLWKQRPPLHPDARARGNTGNGKGKGKAPAEKSNASSAARPASATSPKKGSKTHKKKGCTNKEWEEVRLT